MRIEQMRENFERELHLAIHRFGKKNPLRDACEQALMQGGKRIRPLIVLMTAEALNQQETSSLSAALGVEFFHAASLIADDLPCMDNDDIRRNHPSLHKIFGESIAILASYTLIAEGYGAIRRSGEAMKKAGFSRQKSDEAALLCLEKATLCGGIQGATNGQFLDLYPPDSTWETMLSTIEQKTSTLFEISFLFGWLFGGGNPASIDALKACAWHLGLAFQIADDLEDVDQDIRNTVSILGKKKAVSLLNEELFAFKESLRSLGLWTFAFQEFFHSLSRNILPPKDGSF